MRFKDIAIKNFKGNIKKYLVYYLCNSFIVATFFMYSVLIFNENLWTSSQVEKGVLEALVMPNVALALFSLFFISYAHSSFIRWRKKEFGVYMTLGMTVEDVRKIIIYENIIVAIGSILLGIITGLVFSRLFFIIITSLLGAKSISYIISFKNFIFSIGIFSAIYLANLITTIITTYKFEVINLLKAERKIQKNRFRSPYLAIIALSIILSSFIFLYKNISETDGGSFLCLTIIISIALYIFISQLGGFLIDHFKRRKGIYYKKLLFITSLNSKFKQTQKIIFIICILLAVVIFYTGAMLSFYISSEKAEVDENTYHLSYAEIRDKNIIAPDRLKAIVEKNNEKIVNHEVLEFLYFYGTTERADDKIIMTDKEINKLGKTNLNVTKGKYIFLNQFEKMNESEKKNFKSFNLRLLFYNGIYELYNQENVFKAVFNSNNYSYNHIMVVNEEDYNIIKAQKQCYEIGRFQLYNFNNWKDTKAIVDELTEELSIANKNTKPFNAKHLNESEDRLLKVSSRIGYYTYNKQGSILLLVTCSYLGMFFFVAMAIVLFLKLLADVDIDKRKFNNLYRIGITEEEIKRLIGSELKPLLFIGTILGIALAFAYTTMFNKDAAVDLKKYFIYSNIIVSTIFLLIQFCYYFLCKKIYCDEILEELEKYF